MHELSYVERWSGLDSDLNANNLCGSMYFS